jgi:hypothetical protein
MGRSPADFLAPQDSADLAPLDADSSLMGCFNQGVESPVGSSLIVGRYQRPIRLADDGTRRARLGKSDDLTSLRFGQPGFASRTRSIPQSVEPLGIESNNPFADRLGMAAQFFGNRRGRQPVPTPDDHPGPQDPIARSMPALGQSANPAFFSRIARHVGTQQFRHRRLHINLDGASILHLH